MHYGKDQPPANPPNRLTNFPCINCIEVHILELHHFKCTLYYMSLVCEETSHCKLKLLVIHTDILDSCRSHTLKYLTPAGVIHNDIFDSCRSHTLKYLSHTLKYLTPAGVIDTDILDSCRYHAWRSLTPARVIHIDILDSCRSHSLKYFTPAGVIH